MEHDEIDNLDLSDMEEEETPECRGCRRCRLSPFSHLRKEREDWEIHWETMRERKKEWDMPPVWMVSNRVYKDLVEKVNRQKRLKLAKCPIEPVRIARQGGTGLIVEMKKNGQLVEQNEQRIVPLSEIKEFEKKFITPEMAEDIKKVKKGFSYCYLFDRDKKPIGLARSFNGNSAYIKGKKHDDVYYETSYVNIVKIAPDKENKLLKSLRDFYKLVEQI